VFKRGVSPSSEIFPPSPFEEKDTGGESKRNAVSKYTYRAYKRDEVPLPQILPLPLERGRGTKGDGIIT